jgi:hypothetical protein
MIEGSYKARHVNKLLQRLELFVKIENRQWKRAAARRRVEFTYLIWMIGDWLAGQRLNPNEASPQTDECASGEQNTNKT